VDVPPGITNVFIHIGQEGDHIVANLGFDLKDPLRFKRRLFANRLHRILWDTTEPAVGLTGCNLNIQPTLVFGTVCPDLAHLGQGVSLDQGPARGDNSTNVWR
jgi:hypothetical protein